MRAIRYDQQLLLDNDSPDPIPGEDECLVRVRRAGVSEVDLRIAAGDDDFNGVLGHEAVGTVEQGPSKWLGKRVVFEINCVCRACDMCLSGLSNHCRRRTVIGVHGRDGCFAGFVAVPMRNLHAVPDALADDEAVFIEPLAAAYQVLAQCAIDRRMKVSVVGAGLTGLLVAQVLRTTGCALTVIGNNPSRLEFCEKKGIQGIPSDDLVPLGDRDVVVECSGTQEGLGIAARLVRPRGKIVLKGAGFGSSQRSSDEHRESTQAHTSAAPAMRDAPDDAAKRIFALPRNPAAAKKSDGPPRHQAFDFNQLAVNEITLLGSRCGPFPVAIDALARGAVDVHSMVSRVFDFDDALTTFKYATDPNAIKVLLRMST
jgi:threonine dehydrogenase-like Zn-dependent dehydrogenase